jgi:hypothetical protein
VSPTGRSKLTVTLGQARGTCGSLHTGKRRLFPFSPHSGHWVLQVDTQKKYKKGTALTHWPWYGIGVAVQRATKSVNR